MKTTARNLHQSPDGVYRTCVADLRACPYGTKPEHHRSVVDLAHKGGATIAEGHGTREVSPVIEQGFWIRAEHRRRGFHADGSPMKGSVFSKWLRRVSKLLRGL